MQPFPLTLLQAALPVSQDMAQQGAGSGWDPWVVAGLMFVVLGYCLAVLVVLRMLGEGGAPATTLTWMVVILTTPWLGLSLYYLLPRRVQMRRLSRRRAQRTGVIGALDRLVGEASDVSADSHRHPVLATLQGADPTSVEAGNRVEVLASGRAFFQSAGDAIRGAERFVHLVVYIFRPDAAGLQVLERLTEAAARGVRVRLLFDSFGSWGLRDSHLAGLRAAGGEAVPFLPLLWRRRPFTINLRNHRKLLVVDGTVAWLGGRNVGDEYVKDWFRPRLPWLDSMLRVSGPVVPRLHRVFVEDWLNAAGEELIHEDYFPPVPAMGNALVGVLDHGPDRSDRPLYYTWLALLGSARHRIRISSPYLLPPRTLQLALQAAARRGVMVELYTNGRGVEIPVLYRAQSTHYRELLAAGVDLRESRTAYNHTKLWIVDEDVLFIGSANMDHRSAELNFEMGVVVRGAPEAVADAIRLFDERFAEAHRCREDDLPRTLLGRLFHGLCRLMSPLF